MAKSVSIGENVFLFKDASGHDVFLRPDGSKLVTLSFEGDLGCTEQHHTDECSIEYLLKKYVRTGQPFVVPESDFMDLTLVEDYQTLRNVVASIDQTFARLPSEVRDYFNHSPELFMDAVTDPTKRSTLEALGVYKPTSEVKQDVLSKPAVEPAVVAEGEKGA